MSIRAYKNILVVLFLSINSLNCWAIDSITEAELKEKTAQINTEIERYREDISEINIDIKKITDEYDPKIETLTKSLETYTDEIDDLKKNKADRILSEVEIEKKKRDIQSKIDPQIKALEKQDIFFLLSYRLNEKSKDEFESIQMDPENSNLSEAELYFKLLDFLKTKESELRANTEKFSKGSKARNESEEALRILGLAHEGLGNEIKKLKDFESKLENGYFFKTEKQYQASLINLQEKKTESKLELEILKEERMTKLSPLYQEEKNAYDGIKILEGDRTSLIERMERKKKALERMKTDPDNRIAKCNEKKIRSLDLSKQFPPTKDQMNFGTCYSHAAIGLIEASVYRNQKDESNNHNYQVVSYSPEAAAVCTISHNSKGFRNDCKRRLEKKFNWLHQIELKTPDFKGVGNLSCKANTADGGRPYEVIDTFIGRGKSYQLTGYDQDASLKILTDAELELKCALLELDGKFPEEDPEYRKLKDEAMKIYEKAMEQANKQFALENPPDLKDFIRTPLMKRSTDHFDDLGKELASNNGEFKENGGNCHMNGEYKERIEKVLDALCKGIPVVASVYMPGLEVKSDYYSERESKWIDGGWRERPFDPADPHGHHAMVIQGIDYNDDGEAVFVFRNSWAKGDAKNSNASLARMPLKETCRFSDLQIIEGPSDKTKSFPLDEKSGNFKVLD